MSHFYHITPILFFSFGRIFLSSKFHFLTLNDAAGLLLYLTMMWLDFSSIFIY